MHTVPAKILAAQTLAAALLLPASAIAQPGGPLTLSWAMEATGGEEDEGLEVTVDPGGDSYTVGRFGRRADFQAPGGSVELFSAGGDDAFVMRLGPLGELRWVAPIAGPGDQVAYGVDTVPGGVWVAGDFFGDTDFDPGPGELIATNPEGVGAVFAVRLDGSGSPLGLATVGGAAGTEVHAEELAASSDGGVVVTGSFTGSVDFDPGPGVATRTSPAGDDDAFVLRLDAGGALVWVAQITGSGTFNDRVGLTVDVGPGDGVVVGGSFQGTTDFDPGPGTFEITSNGVNDGFVLSLDAGGGFRWAQAYGDVFRNEVIRALAVDAAGNIVSGIGVLQNTLIFRLDDDGNELWTVTYPNGFAGSPFGIDLGPGGRLYATGRFGDTIDFDPGPGTFEIDPVSTAMYLTVLAADASFVTAGHFQKLGFFTDRPNGVAAGPTGAALVTGFFRDATDFDPGPQELILNGGTPGDVFLVRVTLGEEIFGSVLEIPAAEPAGLALLALALAAAALVRLRRRPASG